MTARRALALVAAALIPPATSAQWSTVRADAGGVGTTISARVSDETGASLRIYRDGDGQVLGEFRLPSGLSRLDPATCPTFQVDRVPPEDFNQPRHKCVVEGDQARFVFARISDDALASHTYLQLMNGSSLTVRYRLLGVGYGQTVFSLTGSRQALGDALIGDVRVVSH